MGSSFARQPPRVVGIDRIDQAHRELHDHLQALASGRACSPADIGRVKRMLIIHFTEEEDMLAGCPKDVQLKHLDSHQAFFSAVCSIQKDLILSGGIDRHELDCLLMWFIVHTNTYDAILAQTLHETDDPATARPAPDAAER